MKTSLDWKQVVAASLICLSGTLFFVLSVQACSKQWSAYLIAQQKEILVKTVTVKRISVGGGGSLGPAVELEIKLLVLVDGELRTLLSDDRQAIRSKWLDMIRSSEGQVVKVWLYPTYRNSFTFEHEVPWGTCLAMPIPGLVIALLPVWVVWRSFRSKEKDRRA